MKMNKRKRFTALISCVVMLMGLAIPVSAGGDPAVTVSSVTAAPGEMVTVTVDGSGFESVTELELMVTYDTNALNLVSVSGNGYMLESLNKNTPGFVQYSGMSLDGLSGNNTLFSITFLVNESAAEQKYSLSIMVTGARALVDGVDTNIEVQKIGGQVNVEKTAVTPTLYFDAFLSATTVEAGEEVQLQIVCHNTNGLAAGQFSFTYDSGKFTYKSLELMSPITDQTYISSINTTNPGQVVLAFTAEDAISSGHLMTLTLVANKDASGSSAIGFSPLSLRDADDQTLLYHSDVSVSVDIAAKDAEPVYPKLWMGIPELLPVDTSFVVDVYVEGSSGIAAGDFAITYDTSALICEGVSTDQADDGQGLTVVINDNYSNGSVNFSMMYSPGISEDTKLISIRFRTVNGSLTETTISSAVSDPRDKNIKPITLDCGNFNAVVGMSTEFSGNTLTLKLPGSDVVSHVVASWYDTNGRMLGNRMVSFSDGATVIECEFLSIPAEMYLTCFDSNYYLLTERYPVDLSVLY